MRAEAGRVLARLPGQLTTRLLNGRQRESLDSAIDEYIAGVHEADDRGGAHMALGVLYESMGLMESEVTRALESRDYPGVCRALASLRGPVDAFFEKVMVMAEDPKVRDNRLNLIKSLVSLVEGGLSAFAGLIAGTLADRLGLTTALLWTVPFPWILCGLAFSIFYFTYPKDSKKLRDQMAARAVELGISQD